MTKKELFIAIINITMYSGLLYVLIKCSIQLMFPTFYYSSFLCSSC